MIRVNVITEGQSELRFVKHVLNLYFNGQLTLDARCVLTSKDQRSNYEHRGGMSSYERAKNDIRRWLLRDTDAYVSTMFDFFRLPNDFPGYDEAMKRINHSESVEMLETAMKQDILTAVPDIPPDRFIPYIQLHEFESLLFTDIQVLKYDYLDEDDIRNIDRLYEETKNIPPEDINHGAETAPSKRILSTVAYQKGDAASEWLEEITIDKIRTKCPHFSRWLEMLQSLS